MRITGGYLTTDTGETIPVGSSSAPDPATAIQYDANGWSVDSQYGGCVHQNEEVNNYLDSLIAGSDPIAARVAGNMPRNFAVLLPGYTREQELLIDRSRPEQEQISTGFGGRMRFEPFYPNSTPGQGTNQGPGMVLGEAAPDVVTPVLGDRADDDYLAVPHAIKLETSLKIAAAKRRAAAKAAGQTEPTVSPGG